MTYSEEIMIIKKPNLPFPWLLLTLSVSPSLPSLRGRHLLPVQLNFEKEQFVKLLKTPQYCGDGGGTQARNPGIIHVNSEEEEKSFSQAEK